MTGKEYLTGRRISDWAGDEINMEDERFLDMATAISGAGRGHGGGVVRDGR
jgi:hypothetical protein